MAKRGRRPKSEGLPPNLRESADALAQEVADAGEPLEAPRARAKTKKGRRAQAYDMDTGEPAGTVAMPPAADLPFPVEAIALMHRELWNALAERLRSRYQLSAEGAHEMATYAEICIRQYLGPYLAEHAALAGYLMTQAAALVSLVAMREAPKKPATPAVPQGLAPVDKPQYHEPVTDSSLRVPA